MIPVAQATNLARFAIVPPISAPDLLVWKVGVHSGSACHLPVRRSVGLSAAPK